jgi:hypothetical protein
MTIAALVTTPAVDLIPYATACGAHPAVLVLDQHGLSRRLLELLVEDLLHPS